MATIKREISSKINGNGKSEIIIRISVCRGVQPRIRSGLFITPARFKDGEFIKPRANQKEASEIRAVEAELVSLEQFVLNLCEVTPQEQISKAFFEEQIDQERHPEKYIEASKEKLSFFELFNDYLDKRNLSEWRIKHYKVLIRALKRFEAYRIISDKGYNLNINTFSVDDINSFEHFLRTEHELFTEYPEIYNTYPADTRKVRKAPKPQPKGDNTIVCTFSRLRAFFNWCNEQGLTDNKPFAKYNGVSTEKYGTPYYITLKERDVIADFDMSGNNSMEVQRDIFVFQCLIGCRVSDLMRLTPANIINGAVEYIASKTKGERPEVIRVPLHPRAAALIEKYKGGKKLFPFITPQRYNDAIKEIFTICGITRNVTVINPTTGKEEQRPINEIASSHIARRTFIGNLYKQVKDPNLVGKLSGHKEGSKAFSRYRDIDEEMKKELINLL